MGYHSIVILRGGSVESNSAPRVPFHRGDPGMSVKAGSGKSSLQCNPDVTAVDGAPKLPMANTRYVRLRRMQVELECFRERRCDIQTRETCGEYKLEPKQYPKQVADPLNDVMTWWWWSMLSPREGSLKATSAREVR